MGVHLVLTGWSSVEVTEDPGNATITLADATAQVVDITVNSPGEIAVDMAVASTSTSAPAVPTGLAITSAPSPAPSEGA